MTIAVGDEVPGVKIKVAAPTGGGEETSTRALFEAKRVVMFGVPGAFTPTCSTKHLPGFIERAAELRAAGADRIVCLSVNDAFVMGAWGREKGAFDAVTMLADGNGDFTRALGLEVDLEASHMGRRCRRFLAVFEAGRCAMIAVEEPGKLAASTAEAALAFLKR